MNKKIIFWADSSEESLKLRNLLENKEFLIENVMSGSFIPCVEYNGRFYRGYKTIVISLGLDE